METDFLRCDHCQTILAGEMVNNPEPRPCPGCLTPLFTRTFPALFDPAAGGRPTLPEVVTSEEEASCFFHPRKKATVDCVNCGRFLCALCDLDIGGQHLCPACLENSHGKGDGIDRATMREHYRHDYTALNLAVVPLLLFWPVTLLTAPLSLTQAIRYWSKPATGLIPRGHARQIIAIVLSALQLVAWIIVGTYVAGLWYDHSGLSHGHH